jgi:putative intracellular protease/amidase
MTPDHRTHILIPLPDNDFDPTESATPWKVCKDRGWRVTFATEHAAVAAADPRLLMGVLRGPLGAGPKGLANYRAMASSQEFQQPIPYVDIDPDQFDAVSLTGGHAPGMKQYLESEVLQGKMVAFWKGGKVVGAICHGVLVLARAIDPATGRSILYGSKVTALTKDLETTGYLLTFWLLGRRYRTYNCYVADEVRNALARPDDFKHGKAMVIPYTFTDSRLITSRWPLDAMQYSLGLADLVERHQTYTADNSN